MILMLELTFLLNCEEFHLMLSCVDFSVLTRRYS